MSAVCILTPTIIAGWPMISAAVAGAAAALGFSMAREGVRASVEAAAAVQAGQEEQTTVEVEVENSEVLGESLAGEQELVLVRDSVRVRISRDLRGALKVCVEGAGRGSEELREIGRQVVDKVTQMYVYNRVMTELKNKGFTVIQEGVAQDETVHIHVRRQAV
ncbi:MAG: DUF1257 domain-containing protein [Candidatus Brocadiaceae bacterium]|nr:DUF1257 domain-containing protein [Candidatus Brocadiaceae bacterium]